MGDSSGGGGVAPPAAATGRPPPHTGQGGGGDGVAPPAASPASVVASWVRCRVPRATGSSVVPPAGPYPTALESKRRADCQKQAICAGAWHGLLPQRRPCEPCFSTDSPMAGERRATCQLFLGRGRWSLRLPLVPRVDVGTPRLDDDACAARSGRGGGGGVASGGRGCLQVPVVQPVRCGALGPAVRGRASEWERGRRREGPSQTQRRCVRGGCGRHGGGSAAARFSDAMEEGPSCYTLR